MKPKAVEDRLKCSVFGQKNHNSYEAAPAVADAGTALPLTENILMTEGTSSVNSAALTTRLVAQSGGETPSHWHFSGFN